MINASIMESMDCSDQNTEQKMFGSSKKTYGDFCCVPGCSNQRGNDKTNGWRRSYYRFPKDPKQASVWMKMIRRDHWEPKNHDRICSDHFEGGVKQTSPADKGYVPTLFPYQKEKQLRQTNNSNFKETQVLDGVKQTSPADKGYVPTLFPYQKEKQLRQTNNSNFKETQVLDGTSEKKNRPSKKKLFKETYSQVSENQVGRPLYVKPCVSVTPHINNHDYMETETEKGNYSFIKEYLPEIREKVNELEHLQKLNESQARQILSLDNIKDVPTMMNFWTGFPNYETFYALYQFFETRAKHLRYWKGDIGMPQIFSEKKRGPERKLPLIEEFFLTMVRLKVGLLVEDLAVRFSISVGSVSSIFNSWVNLMYVDLKELCELPSRSVVTENQSKAMRDFEDVRVILDCTEIFVQNPSKLDARKEVYSNYKHHNAFKFLVGVSPQMGITYVSRMYGGRASDKFITSDSEDLLQNLESSKGSVMADRGFLISGILNDMGVKLHMPSFKGTERTQLTSSETSRSENISKVRIHVERAIQRIKTFHILDGEIKLSMKDVAEQIFTVCLFGEFSKPYCQKVAIQYTCINEQHDKVHHDINYCHRKCKYLLMDVDMYHLYQIDS